MGFRKGFSTEHATYRLMELIFKAWNKKHVAEIFCDLTKAFDCVNHLLLIFKLQFYGIKGTLLEWFRSYLIGRKQRANFKNFLIGEPL